MTTLTIENATNLVNSLEKAQRETQTYAEGGNMKQITVGRITCFIDDNGIGFLTSEAGHSSYKLRVEGQRHQMLCLGWQCCARYHTEEQIQQVARKAEELGAKKLVARKVGASLGCLPAEDAEDITHWRIEH